MTFIAQFLPFVSPSDFNVTTTPSLSSDVSPANNSSNYSIIPEANSTYINGTHYNATTNLITNLTRGDNETVSWKNMQFL